MWFLGFPDDLQIDDFDLALAAPWAQQAPFWVLLSVGLAFAAGLGFYLKLQDRGSRKLRVWLGIVRGLLLASLVFTLANPILRVTSVRQEKPLIYVLFDGTESMSIADKNVSDASNRGDSTPTRLDLVRSLVQSDERNVFASLIADNQLEIQSFSFEGNVTSRLRRLEMGGTGWDGGAVAKQLEAHGGVTAIGAALDDARQQPGSSRLAGVVVVSDFSHNAGQPPLGAAGTSSPATRLRVPLFTVGVGATESIDMAVELQVDPKIKRAERSTVVAKLRQSGLDGQTADVTLVARRLQSDSDAPSQEIPIGKKSVSLATPSLNVEFPFIPQDAGLFEFSARVEPLENEIVEQNNQAVRQVNIIDDYLRLMYVAFEPTWEWRFIKEVFHRDKLVGMDGFRTYLSSSDPRVRQSNILFLPTLAPPRKDFFMNDVVFLGDMPRNALTTRFQEMVEEFVGKLGGGLVVISGGRFGPRELANTPLADMLPVVVDPHSTLRERRPFRLQRTAMADRYPFMRLGDNDNDNRQAWENLGELPWYHPVAAVHEQAEVLAEHPTDRCADGKTPQPLIAVRKYGRGEVVYLAFDEMWRLRRKFGEKYYRQFWSQLIYRLGMSHALGAGKRFVVALDRPEYRVDDKAILTVEAFDENYEPLTEESLAGRSLEAEILTPENLLSGSASAIRLPMLRPGVFETQIPLSVAGTYVARVRDPIADNWEERRMEVTSVSAELRRPTRDRQLQESLARETGGQSFELSEIEALPKSLRFEPTRQVHTQNRALWSTPIWFSLVVVLMLGEWLTRKLVRLS